MYAVAVCARCSEVRYRSNREMNPGERAKPEDFDSVGDQPPAKDADPVCFACGEALKFSFDGTGKYDPNRSSERLTRGPIAGQDPVPRNNSGVMQVLFAASKDEDIKEIREFPGDRYLVITNRRIVTIDVGGIL